MTGGNTGLEDRVRALADAYRREGGARLGPERDQIINWYFESRRARLARDRKAELPAPDREALDWVESETGRL
ncbi:MAG: hypothetical protein LBG06_06135, partial [Deltaproteobacteria bacterium]|nr:hypothetical protein [Deltaproteobacteria bacterium]